MNITFILHIIVELLKIFADSYSDDGKQTIKIVQV